eukprot:8515196-Pyramimonas_sp.AAC.1
MAQLLAKLVCGCLVKESWLDWTLDKFADENRARARIPRLLPYSTRVWHKTGTITGVVNDVGVIELGKDSGIDKDNRPATEQLVFVGFVEGLGRRGTSAGSAIIAQSAKLCYDAFAPPCLG